MSTYEFTCEQGHDPMVFAANADSAEAAAEAFVAIDEVNHHLADAHADLTSLSASELKTVMRTMIREVPAS